uniref:Probable DNA polymerase n=1 Tax=Hemileccinum impolitum TaxID=121045 RepID=A0A8F0WQB6_9AGAM|nr:DNA polymerase [Xerocomus impolitus]QWM94549.1 DNA polymerase [Xerocomus impolitus]QWM97181.1 DNA polymerase [Xerocomus impolitus]UHB41864.1 DNA polymerase [Xerocomus impolitus]
MNNNILLQLKTLIKNLEIKLDKTKNLKSKLEILHEINNLKSQLTDLLELENKSIEDKYQAVTQEKINDINKQIDKASSRGKFMKDYFYDLRSEILLNNTNYLQFVDRFWNDIMYNLDPNQNVMVRFLIQMSDTSGRTLTKTEIIRNTPECLNSFKEIINENINNIYSHYLEQDEDNMIRGFIMRYKILKSKSKDTVTKKATDIKKGRIQRTVKIRNINYPLSTNSFEFGDTQFKVDNLVYVLNTEKGFKFCFDRKTDSQIIKVFKNEKLINTLVDSFIDLDNNLFKRIVGNLTYYIKDGKVILKTKEYSPKFISKAKLDKAFTDNIYTADIETLTKLDAKGRRYFEPYSVAYYDGTNSKLYYVTDYLNWNEMMNKFFIDLFDLNLKDTDIYFHNLSGFDVNFLLNPLLNIKGVKSEIMLREDKFIQIKITYGKSSFNIKDSLLILPGSLMNLSKSFKIETPKEIFPRKLFEKETFPADYITEIVPDYNKYFNHSEVSLDDYKNYCSLFENKSWSLKTETLKYVDIDCIALHQILIKFGNIIYDRWGIDIKHTPTLPALCFKIYRSRYMPKDTIPIITGIPYRDIKQSYTGGSTDMYIPYGENIWCYDVNSLYPTAMKNYKYPVGKFITFNNLINLSISELENLFGRKLFGFIEANIDCPENLLHPVLQIRREVNNNLRTFSPSGTFTGWFHTEEILEAMKLGYKINIISGYLFEEAQIFNDYIDDLYQIKMDADKNKDGVWRLISKNLMNSLYGRFGMNQYLSNNVVIDKDDAQLENIFDEAQIEDIIELDDKLLIQYLPKGFDSYSYQENLELDISVVIASSVTAYSRIIMSKFKNNDNYNLHYTDTDSLYMSFKSDTDRLAFEKCFVDPLKLGYLKIENPKINGEFVPYERFYFLGPKFYVGILNNEIDFSSKTKIRGLQKSYRWMIDEDKIKSLLDLNRKSIKIQTMKWYKNISESTIYIENRPYKLDISNFKRSLIYNYYNSENILLTNTKSIIMKDNKISSFGNFILKENVIYEEISNIKSLLL